MFGWTEEELFGKGRENIMDIKDPALSTLLKERESSGSAKAQLTYKRKNGTTFAGELSTATFTDSNGEPRTVATIRDVTERKNAEEELCETKEYLENLIDYANAPIIVWDTSFNITRFNHAFEELAGFRSGDVIGRQLDILFPEESKEASLDHIRRTVCGERWETVEIPILRADGSIRDVLWNSANIYDQKGTSIVATIAQGQDITERKQAEKALREDEKRLEMDLYTMTKLQTVGALFVHEGKLEPILRDIVDAAIGISSADFGNIQILDRKSSELKIVAHRGFPDWWIEYWNGVSKGKGACGTALEKGERVIVEDVEQSPIFVGTPSLEIQLKAGVRAVQSTPLVSRSGEPLGMFSTHYRTPSRPDEHALRHLDLLARQAADIIERAQNEEELLRYKDELELRVQERTEEFFEAKEELEVINEELMNENEEHLKLEEELRTARDVAEAAGRAKADFMANMSHEIRTPMNAVIGMTSIMLEEPLTPEQKDFVETIQNSGNALLVIINDILDFSRLDREKAELEEQFFDLRALVEEALDLVALKATEKGINLAYIMAKDVPETIYSDPARLRQVLLNLLNNAVKFTDRGEILVSVGQAPAGVRHEMRFSVQDTGKGIQEEHLEKIFEPFSQADTSLSRDHDGVGLGLAITRKLVELMGGKIGVKSEPGKGSCFRFNIMARVLPDEPGKIPLGEQPELKGKRVLIIDESKANRMILGRLLHEWGMMPLVVTSAKEARELGYLNYGQDYDAAILGANVAEMERAALTERMREKNRGLPMMLLAPIGTKPTDGLTAVLPLPIKPLQLFNTLISIFALAPAQEAASDEEQAKADPLRILLAEDNASSQKVTLQMLNKLGYMADLAANGQETVEALKRQHYDLVLMDIKMPVMNGWDATREIRTLWPENGPKIIALTAYALAGDREKCLDSGMDGYIAKPVALEDLRRILKGITN